MVFTTRPDGYCDYQSQQWVDYTGIPMSEHIGDGWNQLLHPDDRPRAFAAWRAAVGGLALYDLEYRVRRHDGAYEWFRVIGRPIRDASGGIVRWFGVAMNIEGLKQVEQALRASEARFRSLADSNIIGVVVADPVTGRVFDANDEYLRIIGCSREELLAGAVNWRSSTSSKELSREGDLPRNRQSEGRVEAFETTYIHRDGTRVPVIIGGSFLPDDPKKVVVFALDMTAHKMAEEALRQLNETLEQRVAERTELAEGRAKQLQSLAMELIEAEERERRRIAELLHDDLQQILAAARMQLQAVCETIPPEPMLAGVEQLLEESIGKSRRLSHELSPAVLHHSSLAAALKWLAGQMMDQFGLQVQLESNAEKQVEIGSLKVFLFRAVQELLFNVVKHAGVKSAHVVLSGSDSSLAMMVSDQGQGFDPGILDSYTATRGFGLLSLRERARYIGGSLVIESAPGQGSRFTLTVLSVKPITRYRTTGGRRRLPSPRQDLHSSRDMRHQAVRRRSRHYASGADPVGGGPAEHPGGGRGGQRAGSHRTGPAAQAGCGRDGRLHAGDGRHRSHRPHQGRVSRSARDRPVDVSGRTYCELDAKGWGGGLCEQNRLPG
jgi:PAS domain S-box-containing protein